MFPGTCRGSLGNDLLPPDLFGCQYVLSVAGVDF